MLHCLNFRMEGCVSTSPEEKLKRGYVLKLIFLITATRGQRGAKMPPESWDSQGQAGAFAWRTLVPTSTALTKSLLLSPGWWQLQDRGKEEIVPLRGVATLRSQRGHLPNSHHETGRSSVFNPHQIMP